MNGFGAEAANGGIPSLDALDEWSGYEGKRSY